MHEQKISIAVHNPKKISDLHYLLREYYNEDVPLHDFDSTASVVSELESGKANIGAFVLPDEKQEDDSLDGNENWWIRLANNRSNIRIFAHIPHIEAPKNELGLTSPKLVVVAIKEPEASQEDITLLYVEADKMVGKARISSALKECGFASRIIKSVKLQQVEGVMFHLIELEGFYLEENENLRRFSKSNIKPYIRVLGHYAKQIVVGASGACS